MLGAKPARVAGDAALAAQKQGGGGDQATGAHRLGAGGTGGEGAGDFHIRQRADGRGDGPRAQVAVGVQVARRDAPDACVAGQIDGIGNQRGGGIGSGGGGGQHGHGIGDAKRLAAPAQPAGGDPAGVVGAERDGAEGGAVRCHQAKPMALCARQMHRDIAAVVDACPGQRRGADHRRKDGVGHGTRHRGHRRDEHRAMRCGRRVHPARDDAGRDDPGGTSQERQFGCEVGQDRAEPRRRGGECTVAVRTVGHDDQVDRSVVQMQPVARQQMRLRAGRRERPAHRVTLRMPGVRTSARGRTRSPWPPSAA